MPPQLTALLRRRRRLLILAAAAAYATYRLYNSSSVAAARRRLSAVVAAIASSAETLALLSHDLKSFLLSDSEQIPNSITQLVKILRSPELSVSISRISESVTAGIVRAVTSANSSAGSDVSGRVLNRVLSPEGAGFVSVVVGSFARNLVLGYYSGMSDNMKLGRIPQSENSEGIKLGARNIWGAELADSKGNELGYHGICSQIAQLGDSENIELGDQEARTRNLQLRDSEGVEFRNGGSVLGDLIYDDRFRDLIGDCVQRFVSTGVTVYLEKTKGINSYDEIFSGLTNPRHETKIKDVLVSVCSTAVETLVKTSHQVMVGSSESVGEDAEGVSKVVGSVSREVRSVGPSNRKVVDVGGWVSNVSSTLAVPNNRRFVLDVTGRVTFETVRSLLEFFLMKLHSAGRRSVSLFREEVVERGLELLRYISAKSMTILTICIALCVQLSVGARLLVSV